MMWRLLLTILCVAMLTGCASSGGQGTGNKQNAAQLNVELGLGYLRQGRPKLALDNLQRAIELDPRLADAHHYAAEAYRQLQQYARAEEHFAKALRLAPKDSALKNNYAIYLCEREKFKEADKYFVGAASDKFYTGSAEAMENAGVCARKNGDNALASERFHQALNYDGRRSRALYQLAELEYEQGKYREAQGLMERYFNVAKTSAPALWLAIRIEHELGNEARVRVYATDLHRNYPNSKEVEAFKRFWADR